MHHDHHANHTRRESPAILPGKQLVPTIIRILDFDAEHLGKVLPEAVGGGALDTASGSWDKSLDGSRVQTSSKLFVLRLDPRDDGDGEQVFEYSSVEVKDLAYFNVGFVFCQEGGMALLPEELASANERLWGLESPSNDAVPLIELQGEITVALYPFCVVYGLINSDMERGKITIYRGTLPFRRWDGWQSALQGRKTHWDGYEK